MMNATALVIGNDPGKKLQLVKHLAATELFDRVKPLSTITALFNHLKTKPADMICWMIDDSTQEKNWLAKLNQNDTWCDLPVVAFADSQQTLLNGFELGACDAIKLTIDQNELSARLQGHLRRWQRMLDLRQSKEQLQKMALTDPLTGLGNRATFDLSINQSSARTQRSGTPFSLLMIDLDHFKQFNDSFGHQAGDEALRQVAAAIASSARDSDICCRYGGEEFAIILPDTDASNAKVLARRIHSQVARASRNLRLKQRPITVSIGISCADQPNNCQPKHLIEDADRALYQAKENGRNCTQIWQPAPIRPIRHDYNFSAQQLAFGA